MLGMMVDWMRYGRLRAIWRMRERRRLLKHGGKDRHTTITWNGDQLTCHHKIGGETWVWVYRHKTTQEALRSLGIEAAKGGAFLWTDAAIVSRAMRTVRDEMEAQASAAGF